jgi:hypothetical protein
MLRARRLGAADVYRTIQAVDRDAIFLAACVAARMTEEGG